MRTQLPPSQKGAQQPPNFWPMSIVAPKSRLKFAARCPVSSCWPSCLFIYALFGNSLYRSDTSTDFRAWWLKRRGLAQGCVFSEFRWYCSPLRGQIPQNKIIFGAWIGVFRPNPRNQKHAYYENYCIDSNQILANDKDHQMPFVGGPNTRTAIQDGGRPSSWKNRKIAIYRQGLTYFDKIWHGDAVWRCWAFPPLKFKTVKIIKRHY